MHLNEEILALVLAGGKGERLHPLTMERTKPSVPFGGKYRIIDFALSNLINSGIYSIYVLVQYKSQSLIEHIRTTWRTAGVLPEHFITVVPPQMRREGLRDWYRGTADSVYQNINLIYDFKPKYVAIFSGDHIYRMNIRQMIDFHVKNKSHLTISVLPIPSRDSKHFGILEFDKKRRINNFQEKPVLKSGHTVYASMGNYIFNADILSRVLEEMAGKTTTHDFGKDIIPYLIKKNTNILAYDYSKNRVPGLKKYEEKAYWRDVGTLNSFWQTNMDLLGRHPKLDLNNQLWPIFSSSTNYPPSYVIGSMVDNSCLGVGARICDARVKNSILGRGVIIEEGCDIEDSIIMDNTIIGKHCKFKKVIIDRCNTINKNTHIGFHAKDDAQKYYVDSSSNITVIKRGARKDDNL